ncbi:hypothetical protein GCM10011369_11900 [Neiella marina]|uniref:Flavodoxin-like fold domain-containing protein n=1 Tax=Neiella marina TaxID=508461 RepID=A0A8J2XNV6_9GAMM|nr:NAD(P)H-dependent oxidoreductase [Neiella marina]GGA71723.1 hypothetical protein GCM10011369_11900 [Neiella marina]
MSQVVVISGHPQLESSYTNKVILQQLSNEITDVEIRRLDMLYPDYQIDVAAEQQALQQADVIVLQFPFYWYSVPALLKKWIDDVFSFNFAYGPEGDKLKGKDFILSFTIGGPEEAYTPTGYNHFRIEELMKPLEQTAYLAKMNYQAPIYTHGMVYIPDVYNTQEQVESRAASHANKLLSVIEQLLHEPKNIIKRFVAEWFEQMDRLPEDSGYFKKYLADDFYMNMPEGAFNGISGFEQWYEFARSTFKPDCRHEIEQLDVTEQDGEHHLSFRVRVIADTFAGESINLLVNETWRLMLNQQRDIKICDYKVDPVVS